MIGLVLVTHGRLADELVSALVHIVGPQEKLSTVCIEPDDDMEQRRLEILDKTQKNDTGAGVILLTDMFGGTPSNLAISIMDQGNFDVVTGVNLPMLIKCATLRNQQTLGQLVLETQKAGRQYINIASQILAIQSKSK